MKNFWVLCCFGSLIISLGLLFFSEENSFFNGSPLSFLQSFKEVKLTFPTSAPGQTVTLKLKSRPGTVRPNLNLTLKFLRKNFSHMERYTLDVYDCKQFALRLFEDAMANNFESRYVIITLLGQAEGHALTAIETSDAGTLYVDFTPFILHDRQQKPSRTVAQVREGSPYLRVPIEFLDDNFRNEPADFEAYETYIKRAESDIEQYNGQLSNLETRKRDLEGKIVHFNSRMSQGVNTQDMVTIRREQEALQHEVNEINGNFDVLNVRENLLKKSYATLDWIGKDWIVKTVKIVP